MDQPFKLGDRGALVQSIRLRALPAFARTRAFAQKRRRPILALALVAFVAGCIISIRELGLNMAAIRPVPLLVLATITIPLSIAYSAVNLMLMGKAAGTVIGFWHGIRISVIAQASEILPLPAGAIVRTASLVRAGGSSAQSIELVLVFALLWVATAALGAGLTLVHLGWGAVFLAVFFAAWLSLSTWLALRFGVPLALAAIGLRLLGVVLVSWRLWLAFLAIGLTLAPIDCLTFAFATILGSTAAIVPAGLGIGEGLSALFAGPSGIEPAAAFLAVALSRFVGLAFNILAAMIYASLERTNNVAA